MVTEQSVGGVVGRRSAGLTFGTLAVAALVLVAILAARGGVRFSSDYYDIDSRRDPAGALAEGLVRLGIAPEIDAAELATAIDAVRTRAQAGDVEATRFLAALMERQGEAASTP